MWQCEYIDPSSKLVLLQKFLLDFKFPLLVQVRSFLDHLVDVVFGHPLDFENFLAFQVDVAVLEPLGVVLPNFDGALNISDLLLEIDLLVLHFHQGLSVACICLDVALPQIFDLVQSHQDEVVI